MRNRTGNMARLKLSRLLVTSFIFTLVMALILSAEPLLVSFESVTPITGSGDRVTEIRDLQEFRRIETNIPATILIRTGRRQSVTVSLDENLVRQISTTVDNGTLTIRSLGPFTTKEGCLIGITIPDLSEIVSFGEESFDIDIQHGEHLVMNFDGSGKVSAVGSVNELKISVTGNVDVESRNLTADKVQVSLEGMGKIQLYAQSRFSGEISGWGSITYYGEPSRTSVSISGVGTIKPGLQEEINE